jgi:hypothetical protein
MVKDAIIVGWKCGSKEYKIPQEKKILIPALWKKNDKSYKVIVPGTIDTWYLVPGTGSISIS